MSKVTIDIDQWADYSDEERKAVVKDLLKQLIASSDFKETWATYQDGTRKAIAKDILKELVTSHGFKNDIRQFMEKLVKDPEFFNQVIK